MGVIRNLSVVYFLVIVTYGPTCACSRHRRPRGFTPNKWLLDRHSIPGAASVPSKRVATLLLALNRVAPSRTARNGFNNAKSISRAPPPVSRGSFPTSYEVDTLIFDIDDTLYSASCGFSRHRMENVTTQFMVERLGFKTQGEAYNLWTEYIKRYHSTLKAFTRATQEGRFSQAFKQEDLGKYWAEHCDFSQYLSQDTALIDSLETLKSSGLKLVAFSNAPRAYAIRVLEVLGLRHTFSDERIFGVEDVMPACKPEAEAFQTVLSAVGSQPHRSVMIEDSMKNIRACRRMGMHTVLVQEGIGLSDGEAGLLGDSSDPNDPAVGVVLRRASAIVTALPGLLHSNFEAQYKDASSGIVAEKTVRAFDYKSVISAVNKDTPLVVVDLDGEPCKFNASGRPLKIGVLDSSFNPPTLAHGKLLELADGAISFDMKLLMLGKSNADKAIVGAQLDERLAMMQRMAAVYGADAAATRLAVTSHALFVDKARSLLRILSEEQSLASATVYFIVGSDTIVRIFDPKYYENPERELGDLFRMAHLISVDRDETSIRKTTEALKTPLAQMFKDRVTLLKFHDPDLQSISSTRARDAAHTSESLAEFLLPDVEEFVRTNPHMYSPQG